MARGQDAQRRVGRAKRDERVDRDVGNDEVGARGERKDRLGGVDGAKALEPGDRLQLHARVGIAERLNEQRLGYVVQLVAAIGQRPQRELAHGGIGGGLHQHAVRADAGELLQREDRRHARRQRPGAEHALLEQRDALGRRPAPDELVLREAAVHLIGRRDELDEPRVASRP